MPIERVVLAGFMGSGKTSVGRALAERLGWKFVDLDDAVALHEGCSVPALLLAFGEARLRLAETTVLRAQLQHKQVVIALGGGAPETPAVQAMLRETSATSVFFLSAPFELLYARCVAQTADPTAAVRPLLGSADAAHDRFQRRLAHYAAIAQHTIDAAGGRPSEVAEGIFVLLNGQVTPADTTLVL